MDEEFDPYLVAVPSSPLCSAEGSNWRPERGAGVASTTSTEPIGQAKAVADTDPYLSLELHMQLPGTDEVDNKSVQAAGPQTTTLDLLTVSSMPASKLAELLRARQVPADRVLRRGKQLWRSQTITELCSARAQQLQVLEQRLGDGDLATSISVFRRALQTHERVLFDRALFFLAVADQQQDEQNDEQRFAAIIRQSDLPQHTRKRKRDRNAASDPGMEKGIKHSGHGLCRDRLALCLGLAGISTLQVLDKGAQLCCECQGRIGPTAERYATQCMRNRLPCQSLCITLQFLQNLLGDVVYKLLQEDLLLQASAYMQLRCSSSRPPTAGLFSAAGGPDHKSTLVALYRDLVECHSRGFTPFERRCRVRQLEDAVLPADTAQLAQIVYGHLQDDESEAWSRMLHSHGLEKYWMPV